MNKELLNWILNELDETQLQDICKKKKVKVPGFINISKCPKALILSCLLKNRDNLFEYLKELSNNSDEKIQFQEKDIVEIKSFIDIEDRKKTIKQIIYLITQDSVEYTNLANEIIDKIREKDNIENARLINEEIKNNINGLNEIITEKRDDNMINDEININKFIVTIKEEPGLNIDYYNIYPLYKIKNEELIEVERDAYPDYGNINVNPYLEFSKKNYDTRCPLWICRFSQEKLEATKFKTKFRIDGDKLITNNDIYDINQEGIYEIAELREDDISLDEIIYNDKIEIKNKPIGEKFYLTDNNYIYGPFGYIANSRGGGYYIDKQKNDYVVEKYKIRENERGLSIIEINNPYEYNNSYIKAVYFYNNQNLFREEIDTISDQKLFDKLREIIDRKNIDYSKAEIEKIRKNIGSMIDNSLSESRRERIRKFIMDTQMMEKFIENDLIDIINLLLDDKNTKEIISNKILEQNEILRKLQNVELVQAKIQSKNEELEKTKQELGKIRLEIKDMNNQNEQKLIQKLQSEIKEITEKKEKVEIEIEKLIEKYELCSNIDLLSKKIEELKKKAKEAEDDYNVFSRKNKTMKGEAKRIEEEIKEKLKNATSISTYSDIAFDGVIANEILESAAKWNKKRNEENFESAVASKEKVEKVLGVKSFKDIEIIDYIYEKFSMFRNYSKNDIINMMMCISQGFITVFAGEPGVGKTSVCNIISNVLGLSNGNDKYNRFTEVSVEKGWTSKRDLIGYYNPLSKSFDKNNGLLFKTFNILNQECKKEINDFPYYVLLDEANLSSMEHYWADFMNVCDFDKENRKINLGEEYIYSIPKTLRFLATINYDHTTETLSPRLIDRAWVILLESHNSKLIFNNDKECQPTCEDIIMFKDLEYIFSLYYKKEEDISNQMFKELDEIYKKFYENNIIISPRINSMIIKYLKVGCNLFEETESTLSTEFVALDYAVAQKLLPKINGYGEEYRTFLQDIKNKFDKNNMVKCKNIINNIIKKGDTNMQYYQFFS